MIRDPFAHSNLSDQETAVLRSAADGLTDREIALRLRVSEKTIDTYWSRIRQKLSARNRTHAVAKVFKDAYHDKLDPLFGCDEMLRDCEEGIWILDMRGNTVFANQKLADLFGYTLREMHSVSGWDLLDEEGRSAAKKVLEEFPDGRRDSFYFRFKKKDGSDLHVMMTTTPITDDSGRTIRTLGMLNEINPETLGNELSSA